MLCYIFFSGGNNFVPPCVFLPVPQIIDCTKTVRRAPRGSKIHKTASSLVSKNVSWGKQHFVFLQLYRYKLVFCHRPVYEDGGGLFKLHFLSPTNVKKSFCRQQSIARIWRKNPGYQETSAQFGRENSFGRLKIKIKIWQTFRINVHANLWLSENKGSVKFRQLRTLRKKFRTCCLLPDARQIF